MDLVSTPCLTEEQEKGRFLNVIFLSSDFATLILPEDIATKRPCWVYYTRMPRVYSIDWGAFGGIPIIIIRDWRGLAELLILVKGQCEGQTTGISKEVSPTSFLYP